MVSTVGYRITLQKTNFIVNKRIMPVIFLISFSKNLHFFELILDEI